MFWLSLQLFFKKVFLWCKKNWQMLAGVAIAIVVAIITRGERNELKQALEISNKKAKEDLRVLQESYDSKIAAERARAEQQRQAAETLAIRISEIEKKYQIDVTSLSRKKRKQLENLLNESQSSDISESLASILGSDLKS